MLKIIREFFYGKAEAQANILMPEKHEEKHILDWLYEGSTIEQSQRALRREDYRMVGEPVLTLISSLRKDPKRFKIETISIDEYKECCDSETYEWMQNVDKRQATYSGVRFMRFKDTKSNVSKTLITYDNNIYRVDGLSFNLNHWELKALHLAFHKAKNRNAARKRRERIRCMIIERERNAKEALDKAERLKYAEIFK